MDSRVNAVARHPAPLTVVVAALAATAAVFIFARPEYHPTYESKMIDFSKVEHHSPGTVRVAFAQRGVRLSVVSHFNGMTILSNDAALSADALQVIVAPRTGSASWGPRLEAYDKRFDNVLVTYGGEDEHLIAELDAAVSSLR
jgi:hypothetical protein